MDIRSVGVIGTGVMGTGIARLCASKGIPTVLVKWTRGSLKDKESEFKSALGMDVERGRVPTQTADAILANLTWSGVPDGVANCDLVIESIIEALDEKGWCFQQLEKSVKGGAILASNTSTFPIASLAEDTKRRDRVIGLHFINPVASMRLVEVVKTDRTSIDVLGRALDFVRGVGKEPVVVHDTRGFKLNRLMMAQMLEAIRMFCERPSDEEIPGTDTVMRLGLNHPMGPFELMDLIGIRVVEFMNRSLHDGLGLHKPQFRLHPLLTAMVEKGFFGRKTKLGFYDYSDRKNPRPNPAIARLAAELGPDPHA